jgi:hypothetical protein
MTCRAKVRRAAEKILAPVAIVILVLLGFRPVGGPVRR